MIEPQHVRILHDRPFDFEVDQATGEWPDTAVHDDRMPFGWGAANALAFVAAVVMFIAGVLEVATVPPGQSWRGPVGLVLVVMGALVAVVAWGHASAEQERSC